MIHYIKNLRIRFKLYILIGVALFGMFAISGMSFSLMGRMNDMTNDISTSWLPSIDIARELENTLSNIRLNELGYLTAISEDTEASSLSYLQKEKADMDTLLSTYGELIDEEERSFYENAKNLWSQYDKADKEIMALAKQGQKDEARAVLEGECVELYNALNNAFTSIVTYNTEGSDAATEESLHLYRTAIFLMAAVILAVILVGVFFSFVIIRMIKFPISEIQDAAMRMADGDLDVEISYTSKDELGILAAQVRRLIHKLQVIIDDENKFLAKMADGDFTVDSVCEAEYTGGFHPLLVSFRGIADKLNDTMQQINQSSTQVASGSQALSQGATEQASSVQELASTINEISNRIKQNADNAQNANEKAGSISTEMNVSNEKMHQMIQAMEDITSCSNEIGKIIKTIEDIAFQTNILALNAAVEAARAGTAGKGFAVVADEVRNLASKSADASKDTSALIENSLKAVENGTRIADETAKSLYQAVNDVNEMAGIIGQISQASIAQADSIAQITIGVDQISSVVQTNSATAQESAAASEELSSQSQLMKNLVGRFKLKNNVY